MCVRAFGDHLASSCLLKAEVCQQSFLEKKKQPTNKPKTLHEHEKKPSDDSFARNHRSKLKCLVCVDNNVSLTL